MCDGDVLVFFLDFAAQGCTSTLHCSQAATEQKYSGGSKVCCFGSQRQKGKHTQSFPSLFVAGRLLRLNNSVRPCNVLLLPLSLWLSSASVTCRLWLCACTLYKTEKAQNIMQTRGGSWCTLMRWKSAYLFYCVYHCISDSDSLLKWWMTYRMYKCFFKCV